MLIRRALSFVFALCCALLLWPAFAANPTCGVLLLLLAAVAFADPTAGVMVVLALSPVATMAVSTFWGTPGDWAEMVAVAAGLGWLLRQTVRDDCCRPAATAWPAALLACVAIVSLGVQLAVVATRISPALLAVDLAGSLNTYVTARSDSTLVVRPVALLLEGLLVFVVAATPRKADANRRMLRMFVVGACGAAVLNLTRLASGALRSETPFAAALQLARSVRISLPYADVNAAGSYFLLALFTAWGLAAVERRARGGWAIALLVLGAALWISGSRAALVACLVTAIVVSALRAIKLRKYWTLGAVTTGAVVLFATFPYPLIDPRSLDAIAIRAEMSRAAFRMFSTEPLMGIGVGQFFERSGEFIRDPAVHALYARENAHNNFLQILAETGLVGFTAFLWLLVNAGSRDRASPAKRGVRSGPPDRCGCGALRLPGDVPGRPPASPHRGVSRVLGRAGGERCRGTACGRKIDAALAEPGRGGTDCAGDRAAVPARTRHECGRSRSRRVWGHAVELRPRRCQVPADVFPRYAVRAVRRDGDRAAVPAAVGTRSGHAAARFPRTDCGQGRGIGS